MTDPVPGALPLQPLGVEEILGGGFDLIRSGPWVVLGITGLGATSVNALMFLAAFAGSPALLFVVSVVALGPVVAAVQGFLLVALGRAVEGRRIGLVEVWRAAAPRFSGLLGLVLIAQLSALTLVLLASVTPLRAVEPLGVWAALLVVLLGARWVLAGPVYVFEDVELIEALSRSWSLTKGAWWRVVGTVLLVVVASFALAVVAGFPVGVATAFEVDPVAPLSPVPPSFDDQVLLTIGGIVAQALSMPFWAGAAGLLYADRRFRCGQRGDEPPAMIPSAVVPRAVPRRRRRGRVIASFASVVVLGLLAVGTVIALRDDARRPFADYDMRVMAVATAQLDGRTVVITGGEAVHVADLATGEPVGEPIELDPRAATVSMVTAQRDGRPVIIAGGLDRKVRVWDLASGDLIGEPLDYGSIPRSLATAQLDGRTVVVAGGGDDAWAWDLATRAQIRKVAGGTSVATAQLDGRTIVISGGESTTYASDLATGDVLYEGNSFNGYDGKRVTALLDGRTVYTDHDNNGLVVHDLATGDHVSSALAPHRSLWALASAQLGNRSLLITGGEDGLVEVFEMAVEGPSYPVGEPLDGHRGSTVTALATAQVDGRTVAVSAAYDGTVRVWDLTGLRS